MSFLSYASNLIKRTIVIAYRFPRTCKYCENRIQNASISTSTMRSRTIHDVNTNVAKDVILFKYENPKFFAYMNFFAIVQYLFWMYLGKFSFTALKDAPVDRSAITEDTPWYRRINLGDNKYRNTLGIIAVVAGTGSLAMIWMYTLKSVRYLVLHKGGTKITFVTYSPFGKNRMMTVPLEHINCKENRLAAKVQLPIKVRNTWMHYMLDMRGEFKNPTLFDCTAGLTRKW